MKAVVCHQGELSVQDIPKPEPGRGHVLIKVTRAGICGSDLHARTQCDPVADVASEIGYGNLMRMDDHVVMGHEFVGEVVSYGPGCRRRVKVGSPVVALPLIQIDGQVEMTGLSAQSPGAYAEYMLVGEDFMMPVPEGVDSDQAALTEPLAVGLHAVARSGVGRRDVAVVVGCGPIGLAVILMLKAHGVKTVVASDFSEFRRGLARRCGADVVVDPAVDDVWSASPKQSRHITRAPQLFDLAADALHKLQAVPRLPWWRLMALADRLALTPRGPVVFECVGVPGMIEDLVTHAPLRSQIVVAGVCMTPDTFRPSMALNKEIDLRFVFGYNPDEFRKTLHLIADGKVDVTPLVTATVGLGGVADAFEMLGDADRHAKILVDPAAS